MAYTTIDDPSAYFQTKIYTGSDNGALTQVVTNDGNSDLQPDWIWIKRRNSAANHSITDTVRGLTIGLSTSTTAAEVNDDFGVTAVGSDSFSVRENTSAQGQVNTGTLVAWQWKAGTSFTNDASGTGIGSIDSAGSVNTDAGFSIITYTGTGANATVAHGLNAIPKMIMLKTYSTSTNWIVYHNSIGNGKALSLNTTAAESADAGYFNSTTPTSTVFSLGNDGFSNGSSQTIVAYCFAPKTGYSKFGSYTGNGNADGTFVYTGFKPAWIMIKRTDDANSWTIRDSKRSTFNLMQKSLFADLNNAESDSSDYNFDFLSNGFKQRNANGIDNASGGTYIYMAFAESPLVTSTGVPATAR